MGRAGARTGRQHGDAFERHDGAPGPAPDPGAAVADRAPAHRRPRRLHRRRAGDRLAADAAAPGRQSARPARHSRLFRGGAAGAAAGGSGPARPREGDVHAAGNPHIQTDPRNIAAVAAALSARMQQLDPAERRRDCRKQPEFHGALGGGDAALGSAGGGAARDADRGLPQELGLSRRLARFARDGHDRAKARCAAGQPVPRAACRRAAGEGGARGFVCRL